MTKLQRLCIVALAFSFMMLAGCGKTTSGETEDSDSCVVVQVPEGDAVEDLFQFQSKINVSTLNDVSKLDGTIHIGILENGNSVVWRSDSVFLYVPGEASDASVVHYSNKLLEGEPISYEEFNESVNQ